jgi:hypothetical protein
MAARLSTGLVNKMMATSSFKAIFALCFIDIYSGTQPAAADDVPNGTKLVTLYSNGTSAGLSWDTAAVAGALPKLPSETWSGTILADGTAGWFRLREATDAGTASSTTACRYDGAVATSGSEMNLGSLSLLTGAPFVISAASFSLPKS